METATENMKLFMKGQGSLTLKIENQSYFDKTKTRLKKAGFEVPLFRCLQATYAECGYWTSNHHQEERLR